MSDKYVDSQRQNGLPARARESSGVGTRLRSITFETAAADAALDVRRLFTIGAHEIPVQMDVVCDAIAGLSEVDIGLHRPGVDGIVVDRDAFMDGVDLSAGYAFAAKKDGLAALAIEERGILSAYEIANDVLATDVIGHLPNDSYDVTMTFVSEVTAVGTITVHLWTIDQQ